MTTAKPESAAPKPASKPWASACGWAGMLLVVCAYAAKTLHWIDAGVVYFVLNALGSLLLCVSNLPRANYQSLTLNGVWAVIAVYSLSECFA